MLSHSLEVGGVFFQKYPSNIETINDLDGEVVNFFEWVRNDPERLARAVYLTPYSRKVYEDAYTPGRDSLDRAVKFCTRLNMGHGFRTTGEKVGWKCDIQGRQRAYAAKYWNDMPKSIIHAAERLKDVQIECRPAVDIIERFNFENVLIYCDPPYLLETRFGKQYKQEMTNEDHKRLLAVLQESKAKVILSGYESKLYNDALRGWYKTSTQSITQNPKKSGKEVLWMNFEPMQQLRL